MLTIGEGLRNSSRDDNHSWLAKVRGTRQGHIPEGDVRNFRDSAGDMEVTNDRGGTSRSPPKVAKRHTAYDSSRSVQFGLSYLVKLPNTLDVIS